jgi:predicted small integral membrane protein
MITFELLETPISLTGDAMSAPYVWRRSQAALAAAAAAPLALAAWNNLADYPSNQAFVRHVLSMDTILPGSALVSRAITAPWAHRVFYAGLIAWEWAAAGLCAWGAVRLWKARAADADRHEAAKAPAIAGLTLALLLWLVAFLSVGGEWFAMWQSSQWNGVGAAGRMFGVHGLILLLLRGRD